MMARALKARRKVDCFMAPLPLHTFGMTSLQVSPIGLGLAALGRPGYINLGHAEDLEGDYAVQEMERKAHEVLDAAYEQGVRYFDAARSYGKAEAFLASWLATKAPEELTNIVVGSKWGYTYTADWQIDAEEHEVKEHSIENLEKQWQESRDLLGNHLDLYQIHSATLETGVLENQPILKKLAELKANGTHIGLSLSGENQAQTLEKALDVQMDGEKLFDTVQATFNVLEPSAGETLAQARSEGLGVIVKEALANGRLTERNDTPAFADKLNVLQEQAKRLNTTLDALALAFVLRQSWAGVVLSGAATVEHVRSNVAAVGLRLDEEALDALDELRESPGEYWETRGDLAWR